MNENKDVPIRDAATVILLRQKKDSTYVLMGQRGNKAAFILVNMYSLEGPWMKTMLMLNYLKYQ